MKIANYLQDYQLDSPFADWECADPAPFVDIPIGAMFSVIDDTGKLSGWRYSPKCKMEIASLFYKETNETVTPLGSKYPVPSERVNPETVNIPVCVQILAN